MLESVYITLIVLAFATFILSFFVAKEKYLQQLTLLGVSMILFGALGIASTSVQFVTCTSTSCTVQSSFFRDAAWIFSFFALFMSVLFLFKIITAFDFLRGRPRL